MNTIIVPNIKKLRYNSFRIIRGSQCSKMSPGVLHVLCLLLSWHHRSFSLTLKTVAITFYNVLTQATTQLCTTQYSYSVPKLVLKIAKVRKQWYQDNFEKKFKWQWKKESENFKRHTWVFKIEQNISHQNLSSSSGLLCISVGEIF